MSYQRLDFAKIKQGLQRQVAHLARELAPGGHVRDGNYFALNPLGDQTIGSFYIGLVERPKFQAGAWIDHKTGQTGDIIDLVCAVHGLDKVQAFRWGADWLGQDFEQKVLPQDGRPDYSSQKRPQSDDAKAASAARWFRKSRAVRGTLAETYLKSRGLVLRDGQDWPPSLGFQDKQKHPDGGQWPLMMAAITSGRGHIRAVHRTFLRPDGHDKAPLGRRTRLVWPSYRGCIIRLHRSFDSHDLALVEGIEDGLSVAMGKPDVSVWAAIAVKNFRNITLPSILGTLYLCADNDVTGSDGAHALDQAVEVLKPECRRRGAVLKVVRSPVGKDFNDIY